jgi:hypothetical protein
MALYRPASRRPLAVAAALGLAGGLMLGFLAGQAVAPGTAGVLDGLRQRVGDVTSALEVLRVEYGDVAGGADVGGAEQAVERARTAYAAVEADLALIDDTAASEAYNALEELAALVTARAPADQVEAGIDRVVGLLDSILSIGATR